MKTPCWKSLLLFGSLLLGCLVGCAAQARAQTGTIVSTPRAAAALNSPVVDTAQNSCFDSSGTLLACPAAGDAFSGQDAQSPGHAPSYTLDAGGITVTDNVTGLIWERSPETTGDAVLNKSDKLTHSAALAHCSEHAAAAYAGYTDWRLPSIKELYSLINFRGTDPSGMVGTDTSGLTPFIDTAYFQFSYGDTTAGERVIDAQYASSTIYTDNPSDSGATKLFGVNFADGRIKGYDTTLPGSTQKTFFVQCVRGSPNYGSNLFIDNGDQTITDSASGLMWTQSDSGVGLSWQAALAWVQTQNAQNYLGHSDWRLPDAKELQSILDYTRSPETTGSAALAPIFNATAITNEAGTADWPWYWSSTNHIDSTGRAASAVYLAFGRAGGWQKATPSAACYTLYDVHGAGAQRSDPKTDSHLAVIGTACGGATAYGRGPQGDVQRGLNFVRMVRTLPNPADPNAKKTYLPQIMREVVPTAPAFTIAQTLSDGAQRDTIAFDALAFLTGTLGADSFFPPGKVADFWGFQYLRDNDPSQMGHNTDFLTKASLNMLTVLNASQKAQLIALAKTQVASINSYAYQRFVLITAFRRLLAGDLPAGTTGLNLAAVKTYSAELYNPDGQISYQRAQVMGGILSQLDVSQKAYLASMVGKGMTSWPTVAEPAELKGLTQDEKVAVMTYAGDLFSWYAGSITADVYFCPERQGTYFGSFYLKDAPAVGNPDYTISSSLTADLGAALLKALTPDQARLITDLVTTQKPALYEIVERRQDVSTRLRQFINGGTPAQLEVLELMNRYGELDGEIVARYASAFAQVSQTLTTEQRTQLVKMRTDLLNDLAYPNGAYLYAHSIPLPTVPNTDFLFSGN